MIDQRKTYRSRSHERNRGAQNSTSTSIDTHVNSQNEENDMDGLREKKRRTAHLPKPYALCFAYMLTEYCPMRKWEEYKVQGRGSLLTCNYREEQPNPTISGIRRSSHSVPGTPESNRLKQKQRDQFSIIWTSITLSDPSGTRVDTAKPRSKPYKIVSQ